MFLICTGNIRKSNKAFESEDFNGVKEAAVRLVKIYILMRYMT